MLDGGEQRGWPAGGRMGGAGGNSLTDNDRTEAKGHSKGSGYKPSSADQADGWWDEGECKAVAWASWIIAALWNVHEVIVYKCQLSSTGRETRNTAKTVMLFLNLCGEFGVIPSSEGCQMNSCPFVNTWLRHMILGVADQCGALRCPCYNWLAPSITAVDCWLTLIWLWFWRTGRSLSC